MRDFESFEAQVNQLQETAARAGRPPMEVVLTAFPFVMETSLGHVRRPLAGTLDELREDIKRLSRMIRRNARHLLNSRNDVRALGRRLTPRSRVWSS